MDQTKKKFSIIEIFISQGFIFVLYVRKDNFPVELISHCCWRIIM